MSAKLPPLFDSLARELTLRLEEAIAAATHERGLALIDTLFAKVRSRPAWGLGLRAARRAERERRRVLAPLTKELLRKIEQATRERVRDELDRQRAARAEAKGVARLASPGRRRVRPRPLPPPPDPEQLKRDAERARLRALLRPTAEDLPPSPAQPQPPAVAPPPPTTPGDFLHALEKEIQNAVPSLAALGPVRAGAQIAAWTGRVRLLRDRLPADLSALMRPAIRIFLEHLTELRTALDATFVDALEPKWRPPDWDIYVEANRARAEDRRPDLSAEQLVAHHRAMLKALVQPHRRHVPDQAAAVIAAAGEVLPPTDGQLRSAIRRHHALRTRKPGPAREARSDADESTLAREPLGTEPYPAPAPGAVEAQESGGETAPENDGPTAEPAPSPPAAVPPGQGEFDQPWTK